MALQVNDARELTAKAAEAARLLAALANKHRVAILCELIGGERSVGNWAYNSRNRVFRGSRKLPLKEKCAPRSANNFTISPGPL